MKRGFRQLINPIEPESILITEFGNATNIYTSPHYGSSGLQYVGWHKVSEEEQYSIWRYKDNSFYYCKTK